MLDGEVPGMEPNIWITFLNENTKLHDLFSWHRSLHYSRSRGKEKLGDHPDFAKASYYFNPVTDT